MRQVEPTTQGRAADTESAEFLRMASVMRRIGLGRSTIYRLIASRDFPAPVKLAGRAVGWRPKCQIAWNQGRSHRNQHGQG